MNIQVKRLIEQNLKKLINNCIWNELPYTDITAETKFKEDLGFNTLDYVELLILIENTYKIQIPDNEFEKVETFGDALNLLIKLIDSNDIN